MGIPASIKNDFRETARRIIAADRAARKYGRSQNTIGKIGSALCRAYRAGSVTMQFPSDTENTADLVVRWEDVPPTSRNVLFMAAADLIFGGKDFVAGEVVFAKITS